LASSSVLLQKVKVADLHEELKELLDKWSQIHKQLYKKQQPAKLLSELDKTSSILRDMLNDDFTNIIVNDKEIYDNITDYLDNIAPAKKISSLFTRKETCI
jgi:ribonuclease G